MQKKKNSRKMHTLARLTPYINIWNRHVFIDTYFALQFRYCFLIWMCCLLIIYQEKQSSLEEVLEKDNSFPFTTEIRNLLAFKYTKQETAYLLSLFNNYLWQKRNIPIIYSKYWLSMNNLVWYQLTKFKVKRMID